MIKRFYVHNFRCLQNFELSPGDNRSILLLGRNGAGKTTVALALEVLQRIARGSNRIGDLLKTKDLAKGADTGLVRLEIEAVIEKRHYSYSIALELPEGFRELRVFDEKLYVDGSPIYTRKLAQVSLARVGQDVAAEFRIDWHLVALPIVQERNNRDPLFLFKNWLSAILILRPVPSLVRGESDVNIVDQNTPNTQATDIGHWFSTIVSAAPSAYTKISEYLSKVMPDFQQIDNPIVGRDFRVMNFHFKTGEKKIELPLEDLSDGERIFVIFSLIIAASSGPTPLVCFWDEPDNFLTPEEIGQSIVALRKAFQDDGQLIVTSHNPETIRRFSDENTLYLYRRSHLEPTSMKSIEDMRQSGSFEGSFVGALLRGDINPWP
jgi:predicted ATPase